MTMRPIKVLTIFGTRPEAIKLAPVIKRLDDEQRSGRIESRICVTGQHREMLDQVIRRFQIRPDYDLNLMQPNQSPIQVAAETLTHLDQVLKHERPDWVLVQGDTTTVMAAAITTFYNKIKLGHVEAGLRSRDKWQPFPEEINRQVASVIADLHFAPTELARQNLLKEGISDTRILVTGNTVIDALQMIIAMAPSEAERGALAALNLDQFLQTDQKIILVTAHRRENFGAPLTQICLALKEIAERYDGSLKIIYPVHLNPNVWGPVHEILGKTANILLTPPIDYFPLVQIMKASYLIITDSGGIQEEAPGLGKPVLVLRQVTERPEGVLTGVVKLVGADRATIVRESINLLENPEEYLKMSRAVNPYGDGMASMRIVAALLDSDAGTR